MAERATVSVESRNWSETFSSGSFIANRYQIHQSKLRFRGVSNLNPLVGEAEGGTVPLNECPKNNLFRIVIRR